jgi:hypothetical protein
VGGRARDDTAALRGLSGGRADAAPRFAGAGFAAAALGATAAGGELPLGVAVPPLVSPLAALGAAADTPADGEADGRCVSALRRLPPLRPSEPLLSPAPACRQMEAEKASFSNPAHHSRRPTATAGAIDITQDGKPHLAPALTVTILRRRLACCRPPPLVVAHELTLAAVGG